MHLLPLGRDRFGRPVYYAERGGYGVIVVVARPRYGKSVICKNLYVQQAQHRNLVVFDYQGEHMDTKWGNWDSPDVAFIPGMKILENFAFYINDFRQFTDWVSMGFKESAAAIILDLLQYQDLHMNDPYYLKWLMTLLPTRDDDLIKFNETFKDAGLTRDVRVPDATKMGMVNHMDRVLGSGLLIAPVDTENWKTQSPGVEHIDNWAQLMQDNNHIVINLNMQSRGSVAIAQTLVGKILDEILPIMPYTKPLIVVEEADFLAPNMPEESITSLIMLRAYALKHQRTGLKLMVITQNPNMLDQELLQASTTWIMGHHDASYASSNALDTPTHSYMDVIKGLKFDFPHDREFAIMEAGNAGRYQIFQPYESVTQLARTETWERHKKAYKYNYAARRVD